MPDQSTVAPLWELYFSRVQRRPENEVLPDVAQLAPLLELQRGEAIAAPEGLVLDDLDALGDDYLLDATATKAAFPDHLQLCARLEDDLTQRSATGEGTHLKFLDAAGDNQCFYANSAEPQLADDLEPVREAQHLRVVAESNLFGFHLHLRWKSQVGDPSPPEAEPADFSDVLVQLEILQCETASKDQVPDLP